jgi:hypothetical protein
MSILRLNRQALGVIATALLAGCVGSRVMTTGTMPTGAMPHSLRAQNANRETSSKTLIYAFTFNGSNLGFVFAYPSGELMETFGTSLYAEGSCSDSIGDVFVSGYKSSLAGAIVEYAYGGSIPIGSLSPQGHPRSCSVDNTTGNVATIINYGGSQSVTIFPEFQFPGNSYGFAGLTEFLSLGYDGSGNLFLLGTTSASGHKFGLAELPRGGSAFSAVSWDLGSDDVAQASTVQWDGKYVTVQAVKKVSNKKPEDWPQVIYRLKVSGSSAKLVGTVHLRSVPGTLPGTTWIQANRDIVIYAFSSVDVWKYPAGGRRLAKLVSGDENPLRTGTVAAPVSNSSTVRH